MVALRDTEDLKINRSDTNTTPKPRFIKTCLREFGGMPGKRRMESHALKLVFPEF